MRLPILALALTLTAAAHAAPQQGDDMERFLSDKGLIAQIAQVHQSVTQRMSDIVVHAMGFLGVPYKRGGNSAESGGLDCSGFVRAVYEQISGLALPRRADQQAAATQTIERSDLQPGDLVFFNTMRRAFSHVGIYVGDGKFVHAPRPGGEIRVEDMRVAYWSKRFNGARRVPLDAGEAPMAPAGSRAESSRP